MREIVYTGQYKRDLKRARKRRMPEDDLNEVIRLLAEDKPLPAERFSPIGGWCTAKKMSFLQKRNQWKRNCIF